ncbi:MAG: EF-hand domain-containing protein [Luteimonas sp.]
MTTSIFRAFAATALALLAMSAGTAAAQTRTETAAERFKALDVNRDGVVSKYEYDSDAAFAVMDANHNNRISATELQGLLGPQQDGHPSAAERIGVADVNGDKELSDEELRRALEVRFNWLDTNRDGNLDLPEMTSGFGVRILH